MSRLVFLRMFLEPCGVRVDKHTLQSRAGLVRQGMAGTQPDVPVPMKMISSTLDMLVCLQLGGDAKKLEAYRSQ